MSSYPPTMLAVLAMRRAFVGEGADLTCVRSAVRPLVPLVYPVDYLRQVDHVGGLTFRGCDDLTTRSGNTQKLLCGSKPLAPPKSVTSWTVSLSFSYLFPFPPRLLQRDHKKPRRPRDNGGIETLLCLSAMGVSCGIECVFCLGCTRWACRRCGYVGADDSAAWPLATPDEFAHVPRACRAVLAAYEDDLARPRWAPARPGGYRMDPAAVVKRASYADTCGRCPPYLLYVDRAAREVVLAVRGLNLGRDADYRLLLDNPPGSQPFDGGYVHLGLLKAAAWLLNREADTLCRLLRDCGPEYGLVLAGHSLGAGVAALMAVVVVNHLDRFGEIPRTRVRCYAISPARCMSLNLAVKYADVIHSVVLQASHASLVSSG
ncbi:hypothetical protein B296_00036110 [Ensete ventricosum]|uniref:Fungal lipase-like domain-containing protein n=1 Tax=Ensete ventricosum TaxID=4639 RepID=A0A426XGC6_ENSVE|nr:hypothetical protein B296_00036110 [Ensete ventricosum]